MKVIESTDFFLRVIMFDFQHPNPEIDLSFRILPVFHVGSQEFYHNVFQKLNECDEILYEGLQLRQVKYLSNHFKSVAAKLNLVTQRDALNLKKLDGKLTHADLKIHEANEAWKNVSLIEKIKYKLIDPLKLRIYTRNLTRKKLAKHFSIANQELLLAYGARFDEPKTTENLILNVREKKVFEILDRIFESEKNLHKKIGIIYGAGHMKRIARFLIDELGYVPRNAEFIEVYSLLD